MFFMHVMLGIAGLISVPNGSVNLKSHTDRSTNMPSMDRVLWANEENDGINGKGRPCLQCLSLSSKRGQLACLALHPRG